MSSLNERIETELGTAAEFMRFGVWLFSDDNQTPHCTGYEHLVKTAVNMWGAVVTMFRQGEDIEESDEGCYFMLTFPDGSSCWIGSSGGMIPNDQ